MAIGELKTSDNFKAFLMKVAEVRDEGIAILVNEDDETKIRHAQGSVRALEKVLVLVDEAEAEDSFHDESSAGLPTTVGPA